MLADGQRLVFVGGLHRSGTTPLARSLAAHPHVSGFEGTGVEEDEGQHLQTLYPPGSSFGGPGRFARNRASHMDESSPLATDENARRLFDEWAPHWQLDRPVLIEKSPPNIVRMRFLQRLYPGASFIMVVRHPVVVTLSTKKWARRNTYSQVFDNWFAAHDTMRRDAERIERLHVLKYEDLVMRPDDTLASVQRFLGLETAIPSELVQGGRSNAYEALWYGWERSNLPWERLRITSLKRRFADRVRSFGYDMDDLDVIEPITF